MTFIRDYAAGIIVAILLAVFARVVSTLLPGNFIGASVLALLLGMVLNPLLSKMNKDELVHAGLRFTSKTLLKVAIVLLGTTLSFSQILLVGRFSLIVMSFTLSAAFGCGYLLGKILKMDWKLSGLISAGTGICGGSAIAAIAPTIDAEDSHVAYAISVTFIFDVLMVILFPLVGRYLGMTDLGYGLWTGTAINDTSSVVAAGYAFSDTAGNFSVIVKLTRTLTIIPVVLIFAYINERLQHQKNSANTSTNVSLAKPKQRVKIMSLIPWFILMFLGVVALTSTGLIPLSINTGLANISRFLMVMALGAIGLQTNFSELAQAGFAPVLHGFSISVIVVIVSLLVQFALGQV